MNRIVNPNHSLPWDSHPCFKAACHCCYLICVFILIFKLHKMIEHLNLAMMARPTKAIWEMWNKALSWPPLSSLLFFSIFLSLPPVLMYSLRLLTSVCVCVCVCVCGEPWGKGTEERASESSCPSLSTSAFSNAPRSMSLCVSREEREGKVHAAERKCGFSA